MSSGNWSGWRDRRTRWSRFNTTYTGKDNMNRLPIIFAIVLAAAPQQVLAAIGCTLSNPAEDLKYLYPEMTTYKEDLMEFPKLKDGANLFKGLRARLGSDLDPIYETYETPYTVYSVFKGQTK